MAAADALKLSYLDGFSGFAGNGSAITLRWAEKTQARCQLEGALLYMRLLRMLGKV